jgi:membrane-associated protein
MSLTQLIESAGYLGVWSIIFAESFVLFFLPGDSLLVTAGFVAFKGPINVLVLAFGAFTFAVLGNNIGYAIGHKFGRKLFQKEDSWLFNKNHLISAQNFSEKHGKKMIVLARFMPIIRTFAPIVAGIGSMQYRIFMAYNVIGGFIWTFGLIFLGYGLGLFLGQIIDVDKFLLPIIILIIVTSFVPSFWHFYQERKSKKH